MKSLTDRQTDRQTPGRNCFLGGGKYVYIVGVCMYDGKYTEIGTEAVSTMLL